MKVQRRGFLGGLVTLPFAGKAIAAEAVKPAKPFDVQAAKRAWRNYVKSVEDVVKKELWQGKSLDEAMRAVDEFKKLNPPPPYAKPKDYMAAMERLDATL